MNIDRSADHTEYHIHELPTLRTLNTLNFTDMIISGINSSDVIIWNTMTDPGEYGLFKELWF